MKLEAFQLRTIVKIDLSFQGQKAFFTVTLQPIYIFDVRDFLNLIRNLVKNI